MSDFFSKTFKRLKVFRRSAHKGQNGDAKSAGASIDIVVDNATEASADVSNGNTKIKSNQAPSLQSPPKLEGAVKAIGSDPEKGQNGSSGSPGASVDVAVFSATSTNTPPGNGNTKTSSNRTLSLQSPPELKVTVDGIGSGPVVLAKLELERSNLDKATTPVDERPALDSGIADVFDHKPLAVPAPAPPEVRLIEQGIQVQSLVRVDDRDGWQVGGGGLAGGVEVAASVSRPQEVAQVNALPMVSGSIYERNVRTVDGFYAGGRQDLQPVEGLANEGVGGAVPYMVDQILHNNLDDLGPTVQRSQHRLGPGAFYKASGVTLDRPIFLDVQYKSSNKALKLLSRKAIPGSSLGSSIRFSQPLCSKGTRETTRSRIWRWLIDMNRTSNLLWLCGPAGAGTTTVAQDIAKRCRNQGWLGAAFFFSRSNHEEPDPTRIILSIVHQLAITYSAYKERVTPLLDQDLSILEEAIDDQFDRLIVEPLLGLVTEKSHPILILIDGLDVCRDPRVQKTLIESIDAFTRMANRSRLPFVWIIASRRDWEILWVLEMKNPPIQFIKEELRIDTAEAREDVTRFLRQGFKKVREKYVDSFTAGSTWPTEDEFLTLKTQSAGLFAFAAALLASVEGDNPVANLKDCLYYLTRGIVPRSGNPLHSLHAIYQSIIDAVPPDNLPVTKRILSFLVLGAREIPARAVEKLLCLERHAFYGGLRRLHSVLEIPPPGTAKTASLYILHTSFGNFLKQFISSGRFDLDVRGVDTYIIEDRGMISYELWKIGGLHQILPADSYYSDRSRNVLRFLMGELWAIWANRGYAEIPALCGVLRRFDFSGYDHASGKLEALSPVKEVGRHITAFLITLSNWQDKNASTGDDYPILRSESRCTTDDLLLNEYEELVHHPKMAMFDSSRLKPISGQWSYKGLSQATRRSALQLCPGMSGVLEEAQPMYFLLGYGVNTCLMVAYRSGEP